MHYSCDWPLSGWRAREQVKRQLAAWSQCTTKLVFTPPVNPSVCVCMRWQKGLSLAFQSCPPPHHALPTLSFSPGTGRVLAGKMVIMAAGHMSPGPWDCFLHMHQPSDSPCSPVETNSSACDRQFALQVLSQIVFHPSACTVGQRNAQV